MSERYDAAKIEAKWQAKWAADKLYEAKETSDKPKWYALDMFPYTSGDLHIGHWYNYAPSDAHARYKRMRGFNVMKPIGFDAFGLPAENAAIKSGVHPFVWTMRNIQNMERQLRTIGAIFDWSREIATCLPEYYKWTEWFFLQFYKHGLAYKAKAPANWCPTCNTVLANEQVIDGRCERCESVVSRRLLEQWFFRITAYAEELLNFDGIEWPERVIAMQRNWIGKSVGAEIVFRAPNGADMPVFTTRPDTVYGVTFMVLAPEHPLVEQLTTPEQRPQVQAYVEMAARETEIERLSVEKEKTGVFTGAYATNPYNGQPVPIWVADYVLLSYGTGIVMGVPAHDQRDFEFARKYGLPIKVVIASPDWHGEELAQAYVEPGRMVNSGPFDGQPSEEGKAKVIEWGAERGFAQPKVNYRLRDWLLSRQRYWGAPIPIIYCDKCGTVPVPEDQLPVLLPENAEFRPTGESPLKLSSEFVNTTCPQCGGPAQRESDTMDTFVCSSWYFLRYTSPHYDKGPMDPEKAAFWLPVDQYVGGIEHAILHLLYSRFFIKACRDMGIVNFSEPFIRLFNQGIIISQGAKMSKSRGNVIAPDVFVKSVGADTVRAYLMFIGPWELGGEWSDQGIAGIHRFLSRVWNLVQRDEERRTAPGQAATPRAAAVRELQRVTHKTIQRVTDDIERFRFNTMLAALMEYVNYLARVEETDVVYSPAWSEAIDILLKLLAPTAPHITEELWAQRGLPYSIHNQPWPEADPALAADETVTVVVQVNGRVRDKLEVPATATEEEISQIALTRDRVARFIGDQRVANVIYVPGRLVNIVLS